MGKVQRTSTTADHKAIALKVKGELYAACVRSVEESQRLHRNVMSMIRWMCGVTMRDRYPCEELRAWVGVKPIMMSCVNDVCTGLVTLKRGRITAG